MSNRLKLLREHATRPRRTVPILLDGEVREQIEAVEDELDRLDEAPKTNDRRMSSKSDDGRRKELEAERDRLRASAEGSTFFAVMQGLQRTAYRALLAQHPVRVDKDGKVLVGDRLVGANAETVAIPLARACIIGHRERPDADAEMLPLDVGEWDGREYTPSLVEHLLGYRVTHPIIEGLTAEADPFATERQIDLLSATALTLCTGDDAVPLPRRRSETGTSTAE